MGHRSSEHSPLRTGITHAGLSLFVFGGLAAALGVGIHVTGNPEAAGPTANIALFDAPDEMKSNFKTRLASDLSDKARENSFAASITREDGDLGLNYSNVAFSDEDAPGQIVEQGSTPEPKGEGIRINGRWVRPGQSLSEVTVDERKSQAKIAFIDHDRPSSVSASANPATIIVDDTRPAEAFARAFSNPTNKPVIALIVGGLGINATHTRSAIDELPPEVTLSFAPDARRVQYWIDEAREAGHEVMLEIPMEAYEYGRMKMHPLTLKNNATDNEKRLNKMLSRANGYFGVINHEGAKFATESATVKPILDLLAKRGIAFVEENALSSSKFGSVAENTSVNYAAASEQIDANQTTEDITAQLMELETQAREKGYALGTGVAYPITIEIAKKWTEDINSKGILLAPASALTNKKNSKPNVTIRTGNAAQSSVKTRG